MNEDRVRKLFLLFVVVAISALFFAVIRGFIMTLLLAAIFAALSYPLYLGLLRIVGGRRSLASLLTIALLFFAVLGPLAFVLGIVVQQAVQFAQSVGPWLRPYAENPHQLQTELSKIPGIERLEPYMPQITGYITQAASAIAGLMAGWISGLTSSILGFLLDLLILLYAMFFFLTDGPSQLRTLLSYLPFSERENQRLLERFLSVSRATLKGTLLIGVIQGTISAVGFSIVGLPAPAFWGAVMIILSVVPAVGGALVWVPAAIWLAISGRWPLALVLLGICGGVAGSIDNVLRPRLVGRDTKLPDLLILVSTLGGLSLFGIAGLILGPLVAALVLTIWDIVGEVYRPAPEADKENVRL